MINVAGDELECLLLSEKSESGGTGRRARLRGVWIHRTGSSPVSRTKDRFERNGPFFFCSIRNSSKSTLPFRAVKNTNKAWIVGNFERALPAFFRIFEKRVTF